MILLTNVLCIDLSLDTLRLLVQVVNIRTLMCCLQGFFDTLRMEISGSGVDILTVCPGPVVSEGRTNAFAEHLNRVSTCDCFTP